MAEEILNSSVVPQVEIAPQSVPQVEENTNGGDVTLKNADMSTVQDAGQAQDITDSVVNPVDQTQVNEDMEALKRQLEEYKMKEEEIKELSQRLGTDKVQDLQIFEAQKQLDIINNQAQQSYITLCNQYGVDYRPEKIEASANELKARDPQAYYDLQNKIGHLDATVNQKRQEINSFVTTKQVQTAITRHQEILNASPTLQKQLDTYLRSVQLTNPIEQIDGFINMAQAIQREAFEYGKIFAGQQTIQQSQTPGAVLNGAVMAQQSSFSPQSPKIWTKEEIGRMSQKEYEKYADEIDRQHKEGLIH